MKCIKTAKEIATQNTDELNRKTNNLKNNLLNPLNDPREIELVLVPFVFAVSILPRNFLEKEIRSLSLHLTFHHHVPIR